MANKENYLLIKDNKMIAKTSLKIIIDKSLFENDIARFDESDIVTMGFFRIVSGKDKFTCNLPMEVRLKVDNLSKDKFDNTVIEYEEGNVIIENLGFFPHVKQASKFLAILTTAKINLPPERLPDIFVQAMSLNNVKISIPSGLVEAMMAELVRTKGQENIPYRISVNKNPKVEYSIAKLKDLPRLTSVFSGMAFEDIKKSLRYGLLMSKTNTKQQHSPIEGILKY